jgi:hypothetical protein
MSMFFGVIAGTIGVIGLLCAVLAAVSRDQRLMAYALCMTATSLVWGGCQQGAEHHAGGVTACGVSAAVVGLVCWRSWPEDWNPYTWLRDLIERSALSRS